MIATMIGTTIATMIGTTKEVLRAEAAIETMTAGATGTAIGGIVGIGQVVVQVARVLMIMKQKLPKMTSCFP